MNQLSTNIYANDRYAYIIILTACLRFSRIASNRFCLHLTKVNGTTVKSFRRIQHKQIDFLVLSCSLWCSPENNGQRRAKRPTEITGTVVANWGEQTELQDSSVQLKWPRTELKVLRLNSATCQRQKPNAQTMPQYKCYRRGRNFFSRTRFSSIWFCKDLIPIIHRARTQHLKVVFQHQCTQQGSG